MQTGKSRPESIIREFTQFQLSNKLMKIQLSHFSLISPDELLPYWFVSHDFAEELDIEFSKEAATAIKKAIETRGVRVDYEADAVTLRISSNEQVIPTLISLYNLLKWDIAELEQCRTQVTTFKRPRPRKLTVGDVFHVPIAEDLVGLGHVLEIAYKAPTVAIFTSIGCPNEVPPSKISQSKLLTILHIGGSSLYKGEWPIIGNSIPTLDPSAGPGGKNLSVGSTSYGGNGPIVDLLMAYAGKRSWSEGFHDPQYLTKLVIT